MAIQKLLLKTLPEHQGKRLDQVLSEWLPKALSQPISKAKARKLIVAGAVYLNGKRVRIASKELQANARVEAYVDLKKLNSDEPSKDVPFRMAESDVLYEDEYLIAVNKPPGLPTQPTVDEARQNLFASVKKYLSERDQVTQPYLGLHHRLDRDTSGVILFTKRVEANAGVGDLFSKHLAEKTYQALARVSPKFAAPGFPAENWSVKNHLGRVSTSGASGRSSKAQHFGQVRSGGDFAHTDFRLLQRTPKGLWIEAKPRTGRTHQIRVHLSELGLPILGDATYGISSDAPRLMLHAVSLTFKHPVTKVDLSIQCPLPDDFKKCLQLLKN